MDAGNQTVFYERHVELGARIVPFAGWDMPLHYPTGTVAEHLAVRRHAGLFEVSHMGRFRIHGSDALGFVQHALTNNAEALDGRPFGAQYTLLADDDGGAVDDAYLYAFEPGEYLLVVNASNREKDLAHLRHMMERFDDVTIDDLTSDVVMLALQGPDSRDIVAGLLTGGRPPEPMRNTVAIAEIAGASIRIGRTGYTGEPVGFEVFVDRDDGPKLWDAFVERGATPAGLGARDTLRLEAALPLYGDELGTDADGRRIPIMAVPVTRFGISFADAKRDFVGREALERQAAAAARIRERDLSDVDALPRLVRPVAVTGRGIARAGARVLREGRDVGYVTSGTAVPYWVFDGETESARPTDEHRTRAIALAYVDAEVAEGERLLIDIRGRTTDAEVVRHHVRSEAPPYARPIVTTREDRAGHVPTRPYPERAVRLLERAAENHEWRQRRTIDLIPSEMTVSPLVRLLSVSDPAFRYAEHRSLEAFYDAEVFYYQGTDFIADVERLLEGELRTFLGAREVETRVISGQMANTVAFGAVVDHLNRHDRRREPRRIRRVLNHHIGRGGHLSAQPMGALKDFVARDPRTERPAVVAFPASADNPYAVDVDATLRLIDEARPELIVFGRSMVLHREPVGAVSRFLDGVDGRRRTVVMYDMAHVLGLTGPHFQEPFAEGADLVTGSTHKTFFGTQRGVVAGGIAPDDEERFELWRAVRNRAFPGSVSNHHLGTMLGLLMAAYEMNAFKGEYQPNVLANAKALARALAERGLEVEGDPSIGYTETHQVLVRVGYGRGPEVARRLEENGIVCNYQALPDDESFTCSSGLRLGVAEMTRFGMDADAFGEVADLMAAVILRDAQVVEDAARLRSRFAELRYCFALEDARPAIERLSRDLVARAETSPTASPEP